MLRTELSLSFKKKMTQSRYLMMLEEDQDYPPMQIVEVDDHVIIGACQERGHRFTIITPDDFLIPPDDLE
jgi:hypothetical protein